MRTLLVGIFTVIAISALAQRECASSAYLEQLKTSDVRFAERINQIEAFVQHHLSASQLKITGGASNIIRIPVVVHVIYNNVAQNISDEQIKTQIDALNRDFRRQNADTVNTPDRFKSVAADVQIEFALATADPFGRATTGIIRKKTNVTYWTSDDKIKFSSKGGDDAWDRNSYLNFWVGNLQNLLGYASVPGSAANVDGVVINYGTFGTINTAAPYNLGRTAVHEVGHWLGLRHVWGDTYCGDDLVDDTPKQGNFTSGCPTGFRSSCDNAPLGDMYMNYMDFTNDACLNLFTNGQKQRMLSYFAEGGFRYSILSSKGLNTPWVAAAPPVVQTTPVATQFKFYPNPATAEIILDFSFNENWLGKNISIVSINGVIVSHILVNSKNQKINVSQLKPGMYFIQGVNDGEKINEKFIKL